MGGLGPGGIAVRPTPFHYLSVKGGDYSRYFEAKKKDVYDIRLFGNWAKGG